MNSPRPIRAAIFDLDGTLVDSMPLVLDSFAHGFKPFRPDLGRDAIFALLGGPPLTTFRQLLASEEDAQEAFRRLEEYGFNHIQDEKPFPGAVSTLTTLGKLGIKRGLWTGRDRRTTRLIFDANRFDPHFETTVCGDDLDTHKPHCGGLLAILGRLAVKAEEALMIGDADADVLGARDAGMRSILIHHGRTVDPAVLALAWKVVKTPEEAYDVVLSLSG